jgi:prepilin-type N-terminal cleavage/methylation domain-containing protein
MAIVRHQRRTGGAFSSVTRAFTLIEILVVVVILGIAAAIVVPAIGSRSDLKATSAARMIMADLIYAQNRSISQQKWHWVRFDKTNNKYDVVEQITPSAVYIKHPVEASDSIVSIGTNGAKPIKDVTFDTVSFDGKTVLAFDELGTPYSYDTATNTPTAMTTGKITLACGTLKLTITIEPFSGELRLN